MYLYVKKLLESVKSNKDIMSSIVRLVLDGKVISVSSLVRISSHAFSTGIAVNNETTSKETNNSSSAIVVLVLLFINCEELDTE